MGAQRHGHGPVLLERSLWVVRQVYYGERIGVGLEPMPASKR